ncbi:hypothetical protein KIH87_16415 [Paraneptunicella aestuarii]|uniref:RipA family octameric membrane protein n=1 Tax=Paraneptunicella aestuarii TaxID=2831148 RepID=UPI001E3EAC8A|nr:hypothetical protein [Paraneptunicella aestuarii]UAA38253.1 hypothetical protein KIH87_16415 [Paraneptunicella aestuarii]
MNQREDEILEEEQYHKHFSKEKKSKALEHALDTRKFEIELYWKRATYFWTLIGVILAGYMAVLASSNSEIKEGLAVILSCLGYTFSAAWFFVNRGSKQWQENWENHVTSLEDDVIGPLYKTKLERHKLKSVGELLKDRKTIKKDEYRDHWKDKISHAFTGPSSLSVSKINQLVSFYVSIMWVGLVVYALPEFDMSKNVNWFYLFIILLSLAASMSFYWLGATYQGVYTHKAILRKSAIKKYL